MQKTNIIPHIVFEIIKLKKSCNNLRNRFFPDIQFSQNHITIIQSRTFKSYRGLFKTQNVSLLLQICLVEPITYLVNTIFICGFLIYVAKYPHAKN